MDKLKPILVHRFWIISGLAILMPLIAWWMASAAVTELITKREGDLNAAFGSVPSPDTPNDTWTEGLKEINTSIQKQNEESGKFLWERQAELMFWPENIKETMAKVPYRGEVPTHARDLFRVSYFTMWDKVFETTVKPYDVETGEGLVLFDKYSAPRIEDELWEIQAPTSDEIWDAQEDVWLLKAILESIHRVNSISARVTESPVRSVEILELRGGSKTPAGGGAAGGAAGPMGAGMPMDMAKAGGPMAGPMAGRGGMMGAGADTASGPAPADFPPEDEFGSQLGAPEGGGAGGPAAGGPGAGPAAGPMAGGMMGAMMGGQQKLIRYVDDDPAMPYKTRGFYLQVVMEIRHVPELLVELTNNPYPVRIVRVQQADVMMDEVNTAGGYGMSGRGGAAGAGPRAGGMPRAGGPMAGGRDIKRSSGPMRAPMAAGRGGPMAGGRGGRDIARGGRPGMPGAGNMIESAEYQAMAQSALTDPDLCTVAIAGLMTIYRPVEAKETTPGTAPADGGPLAGGELAPSDDVPAADAADTEMTDDEAADESDTGEEVTEEPVDVETDPAAPSDEAASEDAGEPAEAESTDGEPSAEIFDDPTDSELDAEPATTEPNNEPTN